MKRLILTLLSVTLTIAANAMSYEDARREALYLTDKMAYELNLNEQQYNDAYEINLDYFLSVNTADEIEGIYWRNRNSLHTQSLTQRPWFALHKHHSHQQELLPFPVARHQDGRRGQPGGIAHGI